MGPKDQPTNLRPQEFKKIIEQERRHKKMIENEVRQNKPSSNFKAQEFKEEDVER